MTRLTTLRLSTAAFALAALGLSAAEVALQQQRDGSYLLQNDLIAFRLSSRPGPDNGITAWTFKPTGQEMIDVLYGQTDYVKGHALGERWDTAAMKGYPGGTPAIGSLYAPEVQSVAPDGSSLFFRQASRGAYGQVRTCILRRGLATAEFHYRVDNQTGAPVGTALRFHSAISPGARGRYQSKKENLYLPLESGILELDESLALPAYMAKYGSDKFFSAARSNEPARSWTSPAAATTSPLVGNWAAWVNRENGDGMVMMFDLEKLLGFYNAPGVTLEPVMRAFVLKPGESWELTGHLGAFTGAKGKTIRGATPLYVVTESLAATNGSLRGEIIPLFSGKLQIRNAAGKTVFETAASPDRVLALNTPVEGAGWSLVALDAAGTEIGRADARQQVVLTEPKVTTQPANKPAVSGEVYVDPEADALIATLLSTRNFAVQCDFSSTAPEKQAAQELAKTLRIGLVWTGPDLPALAIGNPANSATIRDLGLLKRSITPDWPGPGKGAILAYDNADSSQIPMLAVCGSDEAGTLKAVELLRSRFLAKAPPPPSGFDFWAATPALKVNPHTPAAGTNRPDRITLFAAKGEYEPAQAVITAFENLENLEVTVAPLVSAKTGQPVKWKYERTSRKRNGPLWLRWVRYYPLKPENGWTGYPDPLMERPDVRMEGGRSQALWLTAVVSETAEPGLYTSAITCKANGVEKTIPVELTVRNFTLPAQGLKGEPYISFTYFPPNERRELTDRGVEALVNNLVDHGMRLIHLNAPDLIRWHYSTNGAYKGWSTDWLEVSDDGCVAFDAAQLDRLVEMCDAAGKPFTLDYMMYAVSVLDGQKQFKLAFPDRFKDKPALDASLSPTADYYAQEMFVLLRRHLERRGWFNRFVIKIADEPPGFDYWWNRATRAAREAGIPIMTAFNNIDWTEAEKGFGSVAVWQPLYMLYDADFNKKARAAGAKISWYNCGPPPKTSASTSASELRGYLWQAAKADLDIVSWWGIQCWSYNNVWEDRYSHWNSVMYPAHPQYPAWQKPGKSWVDAAPLDSVRWEHIRDGMEDAWYVNLLRSEIIRARNTGKTEAADQAQAVLEAVWKEVFPTLNDYNPGYERTMDSRRRVAEAILAIQAALAKK